MQLEAGQTQTSKKGNWGQGGRGGGQSNHSLQEKFICLQSKGPKTAHTLYSVCIMMERCEKRFEWRIKR